MKINLPNSAFLGNIDPFFRAFDTSGSNELKITANKKWVSVHPIVLSMIAALGLKLDGKNIKCERMEAKSKHYFERMGLFKFLGIDSEIKIKKHESAGRFIPLTQIKNSKELTNFIRDMIPLLHLEESKAKPIKYVLSELVRNVLEHSNSKFGAIVCSQYYKKSNTIRIGIVDTGRGIKEAIRFSHNVNTDLEAIRLALTPGITGETRREGGTASNAGAGLFFIKSIAKVNRNFFLIYSGNSMYKLLKSNGGLYSDPFKDKHSKDESMPYWNGTMVGIDISLDAKSNFSDLLDLIRETYVKSIKDRKKKIKPRFI